MPGTLRVQQLRQLSYLTQANKKTTIRFFIQESMRLNETQNFIAESWFYAVKDTTKKYLRLWKEKKETSTQYGRQERELTFRQRFNKHYKPGLLGGNWGKFWGNELSETAARSYGAKNPKSATAQTLALLDKENISECKDTLKALINGSSASKIQPEQNRLLCNLHAILDIDPQKIKTLKVAQGIFDHRLNTEKTPHLEQAEIIKKITRNAVREAIEEHEEPSASRSKP